MVKLKLKKRVHRPQARRDLTDAVRDEVASMRRAHALEAHVSGTAQDKLVTQEAC